MCDALTYGIVTRQCRPTSASRLLCRVQDRRQLRREEVDDMAAPLGARWGERRKLPHGPLRGFIVPLVS